MPCPCVFKPNFTKSSGRPNNAESELKMEMTLPSWIESAATNRSREAQKCLPLPKGEGRGEGEVRVNNQPAFQLHRFA
jgi:hypothetical protein